MNWLLLLKVEITCLCDKLLLLSKYHLYKVFQ